MITIVSSSKLECILNEYIIVSYVRGKEML